MQQPPTQLMPILEGEDKGEDESSHSIDGDDIGDEAADSRHAEAGSADPALVTQT